MKLEPSRRPVRPNATVPLESQEAQFRRSFPFPELSQADISIIVDKYGSFGVFS